MLKQYRRLQREGNDLQIQPLFFLEKFQVRDFTNPVLPTVTVIVEYVLVFSI